MYNILLPSEEVRSIVKELKERGVKAYICYVPLHSSPMGQKLGWKPSDCPITEDYGARVLRLPLYADMATEDAVFVIEQIDKIL